MTIATLLFLAVAFAVVVSAAPATAPAPDTLREDNFAGTYTRISDEDAQLDQGLPCPATIQFSASASESTATVRASTASATIPTWSTRAENFVVWQVSAEDWTVDGESCKSVSSEAFGVVKESANSIIIFGNEGDGIQCGDKMYPFSGAAFYQGENADEAEQGGIPEESFKPGVIFFTYTAAMTASDGCHYKRSSNETSTVTSVSSEKEMETPVSTSTATTESEPACFPSDAIAELEGGVMIPMRSLQIGHRVKVAVGTYSEVFMFTHRHSDGEYEFVNLRISSLLSQPKALQLSAGHFLPVNGVLMPARDVSVGDQLELGDGSVHAVTAVTAVVSRGLFNPQTLDGRIIVNGVSASTYTTAVGTSAVAHSMLWPMRYLFRASGALKMDPSLGLLER